MLMIEVVANTMLMMVFTGVALFYGMRFITWLTSVANRSVVAIEARNLDGEIERLLED